MTDTAPKKVLVIPNNDQTRDLIAETIKAHFKSEYPDYWIERLDNEGQIDCVFSTFDLADAVLDALRGRLD